MTFNTVGGDSDEEDPEVAGAVRATVAGKKKRGARHGFATKAEDQEKAQGAAKERLEKRKTKVEDGLVGKTSIEVTRVDGKELGLKYAPGLVVTAIQADSLVADWNNTNPTKNVNAGDKVISVNGNTATGEMLKMLRSKEAGKVEIQFQQAQAKKDETEDAQGNDNDNAKASD